MEDGPSPDDLHLRSVLWKWTGLFQYYHIRGPGYYKRFPAAGLQLAQFGRLLHRRSYCSKLDGPNASQKGSHHWYLWYVTLFPQLLAQD
jgi:hypothetical protein